MRVIVCENNNELSVKAAEIVASQIILKPKSVLGMATGSSPVGMYEKLAEMNLDFSTVTTFNLDEYYPIKKTSEKSYYYYMNENLYSKVNLDMNKVHIPNGECEDVEKECHEYDLKIEEAGGIDLQILGIGKNGHIGFNEPDVNLTANTHLTGLTQSTIEANSRFFEREEDVPKKAITMGISSILKARKIILLASGIEKSQAVAMLLNNEITTNAPATILKVHPDVTLICDKAAYSSVHIKLGIDIGGTEVKFAVVEKDNVKFKTSIPTNLNSADELINEIAEVIEKIKKDYNVTSVGVGTPGIIKNGKVTAINLPFKDYPLASQLKNKVDVPVTVDNDANCAALGETVFGANHYDNIVMVTLGTGIGGGIIINKQICHGNNGMGEIGHIIIDAENGLACPCGQKGCWEQYASVSALVRGAIKASEKDKSSILYDLYVKNGKLSGRLIFEAMDKGCGVAKEVFDNFIKYLSVGIVSLINIFGPDAVILSGGITARGNDIVEALKKYVDTDIPIIISELQNDAGAMGAAML